MKYQKVKYTFGMSVGYKYFENIEKALAFIGIKAVKSEAELIGEVDIEYHHSALARGYVGVNNGYQSDYEGRYGMGFIKHIPTRQSNCNNNYHMIEYYIEQNKK